MIIGDDCGDDCNEELQKFKSPTEALLHDTFVKKFTEGLRAFWESIAGAMNASRVLEAADRRGVGEIVRPMMQAILSSKPGTPGAKSLAPDPDGPEDIATAMFRKAFSRVDDVREDDLADLTQKLSIPEEDKARLARAVQEQRECNSAVLSSNSVAASVLMGVIKCAESYMQGVPGFFVVPSNEDPKSAGVMFGAIPKHNQDEGETIGALEAVLESSTTSKELKELAENTKEALRIASISRAILSTAGAFKDFCEMEGVDLNTVLPIKPGTFRAAIIGGILLVAADIPMGSSGDIEDSTDWPVVNRG